jgi:D-amino-acid dehydrogenase
MQKDIVIVGGGSIGLMCAYFLVKNNYNVTVIDKDEITNGTSFGNAGLLSAFKKSPLSYPGVILNTLKLILKGESPVNIHPNLDINLYKWLLKFMKSANKQRVKTTLALFEKYGQISMDIYKSMIENDGMDFYFRQDGLLMIYTEKSSFQEKIKYCQESDAFEILNKQETQKYMPIANDKIVGSVLLKENGHLDPSEMMNSLKDYLQNKGVEFILNEKIEKLEFRGNRVAKIIGKNNTYEPNLCLLTTGADQTLSKQANNNFLLTPAKGYSLTFEMEEELKPKTCALFADLFIAMTPRKNSVRITSKLELGSNNPNVVKEQIESIKHNLSLYTIDFEKTNIKQWAGFRPLCPDDIPILGFDDKYENLVHATGLGWLGITFAPSIGMIIDKLITKDKKNEKSTDILLFSSFFQT